MDGPMLCSMGSTRIVELIGYIFNSLMGEPVSGLAYAPTSRKGTADAPGTRERASIMMAEEQVGKKQHSSGGGNSVRNSRRTTVNQIMQQQQ